MRRTSAAVGVVLVLALPPWPAMGATGSPAPPDLSPPVVALVGDAGLNVLHEEFRTADGRDPRYPVGMPTPIRVDLPRGGTFADRLDALRAGPLGSPAPGRLYAVRGTRLLIYGTPGVSDVLTDTAHGTGVAGSVAGRRTGSAPDALVVMVPGDSAASYDWVARQRWIDVASTSVYTIRTSDDCAGATARRVWSEGSVLFSSAGNTYDVAEPLVVPNGLPETYQVGGVDAHGRTWLPPHPEEPEPFFAVGNVVRPYESGARYSFPAPAGDDDRAMQPFGGTSGATPTVAGYAARLVVEARRLLHAPAGQRAGGPLARATPGTRVPTRGPLADGDLTNAELVDVLHRTARPAEVAGPHRYALEGFGATDAQSHAAALEVLRGKADMPARPDEDRANAEAEALRGTLTARC